MLKNSPLIILLLLFVCIVVTYRNAIHNEFRYDEADVYQGAEIPRFEDRLAYAFTLRTESPSVPSKLLWFRPAAFLTSWQLFLMAQKQPYAINLFNIVFLTIAGFALFRLIHYVSGDRWLSFVASALFCVHPVTGVWVNYAPGGVHGLLVLALMLSSMYYFVVFMNEDCGRDVLWLSLLFFAVALMFHEIACFLPFYLAVTIYFLKKEDRREAYSHLVPFVAMIVMYICLRSVILGKGGLGLPSQAHDGNWLIYGWTLIKVFFIFLGKLVILKGIVVNWCEPLMKSLSWVWAALGLLIVGVCAWLMTARGKGLVPWALSLIFVGFIPVCVGGRYALKEGLIYEGHWLYFTSIGFFVLLSLILLAVVRRWRLWGTVLTGVVVVLWINAAWAYNELYEDKIKYAEHYRRYAPGFRMAHIFLCEAYYKAGRYDEAKEAILSAKTGDPSDFGIYYYLASIDVLKGDYVTAEDNVRRSLELYPQYTGGYLLLGKIAEQQGDVPKAVDAYRRALQLDPSLTEIGEKLSRLTNNIPKAGQ